MDKREFEALDLARTTRLSPRNREVARLILVDGVPQTEAGELHGVSRQRVSQIIATVRKVEADLAADKQVQNPSPVDALRASFAFAVKAARDAYGDEVDIQVPERSQSFTGTVVARTDFHLVQNLGRGRVAVHELAALDRVPAVGKSASIQYGADRTAKVESREVGQSRDPNANTR